MEQIIRYITEDIFENSYTRMVIAPIIIILTFLIKSLFVRFFDKFVLESAEELKNDPTNYKFLKHSISALIFIVGFSLAIYTVPSLRSITTSMLAGAGILAVAVGFASQQAFSNIVSGIFIVIFKPFRVNDRIEVNGVVGYVEDITLRHTVIKNFENRRLVIPNSIISNETVVNSDIVDERVCRIMDLGISYGSDHKKARKIIQEEAVKHPDFLDIRSEDDKKAGVPAVNVEMTNWGDFSINLKAWVWTGNSRAAWRIKVDLLEAIKERFDKEGIEIPFPYQNVIIKSDQRN